MKFRIIASLLFLILLVLAYLVVSSNSSAPTPASSGDQGYVIR